jgi:hypothetical protein
MIDEPVESPDSGTSYFMPYEDAYLMMLSLDRHDAIPQRVPGMPKVFSKFEWYVALKGIYFTPRDDPRSVCFYDLSSRSVTPIFRTSKDPGEGLSVSRDGRYILYSQFDECTSNIMLISHFH